MTHLIHLCDPQGMWYNHAMLDIADLCLERGETVKVLACDGAMDICNSNLRSQKIVCRWCRFYRKRLYAQMPKEIEVMKYSEYYTPESRAAVEALAFDYNSVAEIKKLTYKNVKIGYGAFSTYVSWTRNLTPDMGPEFKNYFNRYLKASAITAEVLDNVLKKTRPDVVHLFNGRHFDTRPLFDLPKSLGYMVKSYENVRRNKKKMIFSYSCFENAMPHSIKRLSEQILKTWDGTSLPDEEKRAIGESFYNNRRASLYAGDKVYTAVQKYGTLPAGFDATKRNIAIFTSSEDEFASISTEYDDDQLFASQYDGIAQVLEHFKDDPDFHFYLRIHPNLKNVKYKYHTSLLEFDVKYKNVTTIKAGEVISSYSLLENVEKVIVFGSTLGIEAAYWGKPTVLLCAAFYNYLDICYKPQTAEEAFAQIEAKDLPPKDKTNALKYGFYTMYDRNETSKPTKYRRETIPKIGREILRILWQFNLLPGLKIPRKESAGGKA